MQIAVVVLNWNGQKLLEQFLPSVVKYSNEAKIYIADNNSTDDSVTFIKTHYPDIKIIQNSENFGFAKGYNKALKNINADVFTLINSDVEVTENWLQPIISVFENEPKPEIQILMHPKISLTPHIGAATLEAQDRIGTELAEQIISLLKNK